MEAALSGKPVITKSGLVVDGIHQFSTGQIYGVVHHNEAPDAAELCLFDDQGRFAKWDSSFHKWNLFMAPQKKTVYVNFYRYSHEVRCSQPFTSFQEAEAKSKEVVYGPGNAQRVEDLIEIREITLEL